MPNSLNREQNRLKFHISIDEAVNIQLKLDLFSWASFFPVVHVFIDAAFRPICDYT